MAVDSLYHFGHSLRYPMDQLITHSSTDLPAVLVIFSVTVQLESLDLEHNICLFWAKMNSDNLNNLAYQ